jgi:hypothetical protein
MISGLKEWAFIVDALGKGKQNIILRKGGIAEDGGEFKIQAKKFLLFPTQFHQTTDLIKPDWLPFLDGNRFRIDDHTVKVEYFAEVVDSKIVTQIEAVKKLEMYHAWSDSVVEERFNRWDKSVHVMIVQVFKLLEPRDITVKPEYSGCKSWIDIDENIELTGKLVLNPSIH